MDVGARSLFREFPDQRAQRGMNSALLLISSNHIRWAESPQLTFGREMKW